MPTTWQDIRREHERRGQEQRPEDLLREAEFLLSACGFDAGHSWLRRVVRDFCQRVAPTGYPFGPWLLNFVQLTSEQRRRAANHPDLRYCLEYQDPTGERAVRNVMKKR